MLRKNSLLAVAIICLTVITTACSEGNEEEKVINYNSIGEVSNSAWQKLANKKIFFGHQSVGVNILAGIQDIMKENANIKLNMVNTDNKENLKGGFFADARIGQNRNPVSKIEAFEQIMNSEWGEKVDVALMKFCYADVEAKTDVQKFFNDYKTALDKMKKEHPQTKFITFSIPLKKTVETWKTSLKKLFGKDDIWEYNDNIKRNEVNQMLEKEFGKNGEFFDIARIESTTPKGDRATFSHKDKQYFTMVPAYTNDGGHLNEIGRKQVAEQLLLFLVNLH